MPFSDLIGQDLAVDYLRRSVARGRLAHALLFTGPEGVGKRMAALRLAQALNCAAAADGDACGVCVSCRKIAGGSHPDVRLLEPDGAVLKIDQIREQLQADAALKPLEGRAKVYILDPADALTLQAENSLLKLLEEPPAAVTLVLVTSQPFALLDTIRSRCQEVRFRPVARETLAAWLAARLACPPATALALARLSAGRPAEALRRHESDEQELRQAIFALARAADAGNWPEQTRQLLERAADLPEALAWLLAWYRDLLMLAAGAPPELAANADRLAELTAALDGESVESLTRKCEAVLRASDQLNRNVNAQLLLDVMFMHLGRRAA